MAIADISFDLTSPGYYFENWAGLNEKWIKGKTPDDAAVWLIILPTGEVRTANSWKNSPRSVTSTHLANLSPTYYQFPRLLHNALRNISFESSGSGDRISPTITLDDVATTILSNGNISVSGRVTDNASGVESLLAQVDLADAVTVPLDADGRFTFTTTAALTGSSDGQHLVRFRATDKAGNASALTTLNWTLDTVAPAVTSSAEGTLREQFSAITLTFDEAISTDASAAASYLLTITSGPDSGQTVPVSSVTRLSDTSVRLEFAEPLANLEYRLTIGFAVTDLAGNAVSQSLFEFQIAQPTSIAELSPSSGEEMGSTTN